MSGETASQPLPAGELIADWLIEFRSERTRRSYRRAVADFADWFGEDVLEASRGDIRRWVAALSEDLADSSVRAKASAVSSFYRHLFAEGVIEVNPAVDIRRPQGESEPRLGLTVDQAHRLIAEAESHSRHASALVWLMAGAGLRVQEACSARIEDLSDDLLTVRVKGGHRQTRALSPAVLDAVLAVVGDREEGPIVVDPEGLSVGVRRAQRLIAELGVLAGISDHVHPHILRHTAATLALEAGASVEDVSALLGHRSIETTLRYVRNRDVIAGTRDAAHRLGDVLSSNTNYQREGRQ
ncbi:MAG: tyrosine-type recombinase/integrase [Actinomycetota bacterium]